MSFNDRKGFSIIYIIRNGIRKVFSISEKLLFSRRKTTTPQEIIKHIVSSLHQKHLKSMGFRKSGNTWIRSENWTKVINIQLSKWNTSSKASFTVNLGVYIEPLHAISEEPPISGSLKEYHCDVRSRIGELLPDKKDKWWDVTSGVSPETLAEEVFEDISQYGLPWLDRMNNYMDVAYFFEEMDDHFMAALSYYLSGNITQAEISMTKAYASATKHFMPKLQRIAAVNSITIKGK
ncbi:DUF4304 domain-containing protein [Candidatus Sumerlaeota bacterium]|nr:DUF4304 domain-containing protein [Candidatus Sumerlaeota bacterium]